MQKDIFKTPAVKKNRIVTTGKMLTVDYKETASGKFLATVRIKEKKGNILICCFWDENGKNILSKYQLNGEIYIEGYIGDGNSINVKFFCINTDKPQLPKSTKVDLKEYEKHLDRQGMVLVDIAYNQEVIRKKKLKSQCVKVNGKWESRLEYSLRVLGTKEVHDSLRTYMKVEVAHISNLFLFPKEIKETIKELVCLAQSVSGDYIEMED